MIIANALTHAFSGENNPLGDVASAAGLGGADKAADAAEAMRVTANDLLALGVVDRIVPEPLGGAHRDPSEAVANLKAAIVEELDGLAKLGRGQLLDQRRKKFLAIG